jgi:uncharacterized membrane protein YvbJ
MNCPTCGRMMHDGSELCGQCCSAVASFHKLQEKELTRKGELLRKSSFRRVLFNVATSIIVTLIILWLCT